MFITYLFLPGRMKKATSLRERLSSFRKKNENPTVSVRIGSKTGPSKREQSVATTKKQSSVRPMRGASSPNIATTRDENDHSQRGSDNVPQQEQGHRHLTQQQKSDFKRISKAAAALDKAGNDLFELGEYSKAMTTYTRALKLKRRSLTIGIDDDEGHKDLLLASVATSINNIGYLRQRSGASADEAMAAYRDALQIKKEILGKDTLSVGKTLNNIGSVYFSTKHWDHALEAYLEAQKIMVSNLGKDHMDVATVLSNIGDVHLAKEEGTKAKLCYTEALRIRWTVFGDHDPKCVRLLEKIASLDMAESPARMRRAANAMDILGLSEDDGERPVHGELRILRNEVGLDIQNIESMERKMALDMVRDKLTIIREMRQLQLEEKAEVDHDTTGATSPLTPVQRTEALSCVKDRLARLRETRSRRGQTPDSDSPRMTNPRIDASRSMNLSKRNLAESMEQVSWFN